MTWRSRNFHNQILQFSKDSYFALLHLWSHRADLYTSLQASTVLQKCWCHKSMQLIWHLSPTCPYLFAIWRTCVMLVVVIMSMWHLILHPIFCLLMLAITDCMNSWMYQIFTEKDTHKNYRGQKLLDVTVLCCMITQTVDCSARWECLYRLCSKS